MSSPDVSPEAVDHILKKLEGQTLPHVPIQERRSAIERAIQMLGISPNTAVHDLVDVIDTHEAQINVHSKLGD